jgi:Tfp pilus assembly protein PilF
LYSLTFAASLPVLSGGCASMTSVESATAPPSLWNKVTTSVKDGSKSVTAMFTPKPAWKHDEPAEPDHDKIGPNVYVAGAHMSEQSGNLEAAAAQYQKALELDPNHLGALLGYARLEDHQNHFDSANKLFTKAMKRHPKEASVRNDMGLCYQHHGKLPEAARSLQQAVEMQPQKKLYRDNLATVLVEQNKTDEALDQLTRAHGEAVGNYNLAYLLTQRHENAAALEYFRRAVAKDSSLAAAHQWIATLSPPAHPNGLIGGGPALAVAQRPSPLPPVERSTPAAFVAPPVVPNPNATAQAVKGIDAGDIVQDSSQRVRSQADTRGVQFPQARRPVESAADADAPMPQSPADATSGDGRLPAVTP